jgi:hypothetical protein
MFDGTLPWHEDEPKQRASRSVRAWPWELVVLLLVMTILSIVASLLFPDMLALPVDHF